MRFKQIIPPGVLHASQTTKDSKMLFVVKAHTRKIFFSKNRKIKDCEVALPNLLFSYYDGELWVYAFKGSLGERTLMYAAPFHNINISGRVCWGSSRKHMEKKYEFFDDQIKDIKNAFFCSMFSEVHAPNIKGMDIDKFWRWYGKQKLEKFPNKYLTRNEKRETGLSLCRRILS